MPPLLSLHWHAAALFPFKLIAPLGNAVSAHSSAPAITLYYSISRLPYSLLPSLSSWPSLTVSLPQLSIADEDIDRKGWFQLAQSQRWLSKGEGKMAKSEEQTLIGIWCCLYTAAFINPCFSPDLSLLSFFSHAHNPSSRTLCLTLPLHLYLHPSVVSCLSLWLSLNLIPFQLHIGPGSLALASLHCRRAALWPAECCQCACWLMAHVTFQREVRYSIIACLSVAQS